MPRNETTTRHTAESAAREPSRTDWRRLKAYVSHQKGRGGESRG